MTLSNDLLDRLVITTKRDSFLDWIERRARDNAPWVFPFGLSCCSLESAAVNPGHRVIQEQNFSPLRVRPEEADVLVFGGSVTAKLLPALLQIHARLKEPKWVMAVGNCAASGGLYADGYAVWPGLSQEIPVDVYVPGCPPSPQVLHEGFEIMHERMRRNISRWLVEQESRV